MSGVSEVVKSAFPIDFTEKPGPTYDHVYKTLKKEFDADLGPIETSLANAGALRNTVDYQIKSLNNRELDLDEEKVRAFHETAKEKFETISKHNEQLTGLKLQLWGAITYLQGLKPINVEDVAKYNKDEAERIKDEQEKVKPALNEIRQWYYKIEALDTTFKERFSVLETNMKKLPSSIDYHFPKPQESLVTKFQSWWSGPQTVQSSGSEDEKEDTTLGVAEKPKAKELPKTPEKPGDAQKKSPKKSGDK